ncbi:MAG: dynamin family protein [Pseudomonadota bacterium]
MQHQRDMPAPAAPVQPDASALLAQVYGGLTPLVDDLKQLDHALDLLEQAGGEAVASAVAKERATLRDVEPSVTLIGQVKAGKTTLVNALIGQPGLLPADINPWTSVVTSLHLSSAIPKSAQRSEFRFFTEEEWSRLLTKGGRMGELASRAGADAELEKVRQQLEQMRDASRRRLGRNFEMLLGQVHRYGFADEDLIQRYVCLGNDTDAEGDDAPNTEAAPNPNPNTQGRFADITRSADLFLSQPAAPMPICLRDTPGVNDTFLVREQITVNAIRASRLCIVVLSAHQALSTVDLGLIRLISNVPSREVIIFVNRIDELNDPVRELPAIRQSILDTLKAQNGPEDVDILFGSAHWATHALAGDLNTIGQASADAVIAMAQHEAETNHRHDDPVSMIWALSGIPALGRAVTDRLVQRDGAEALERAAIAARNIARSIEITRATADRRGAVGHGSPESHRALNQHLDRAMAELNTTFAGQLDALLEGHRTRLDGVRQTFLSRTTAALARHLEEKGDDSVWTYDPVGLRVLLRSGYQRYAARAAKTARGALSDAADTMGRLLFDHFQIEPGLLQLEPPAVPQPPVPVMLGQTIALDIKGRWWTRWWHRRRTPEAYAEEFRELISAEIAPIIDDLHSHHAAAFATELKAELAAFLSTQHGIVKDLSNRSERDLAGLRSDFENDVGRRMSALTEAHQVLARFHPTHAERSAP